MQKRKLLGQIQDFFLVPAALAAEDLFDTDFDLLAALAGSFFAFVFLLAAKDFDAVFLTAFAGFLIPSFGMASPE